MSAFMSDRTPEDRRYFRLQMLVYDILAAEDCGRLALPRMVDGFVDQILALDVPPASPTGRQLDPGKRDELPPIVSEGVGGLVEAMTELADAVFGRTAGDCPNVYADYDKLCALEESTRSALSKATGEGG